MNEYAVISLIALGGFLILALYGLKGRGISLQAGAGMAALWVSIFAVVALLISLLLQ